LKALRLGSTRERAAAYAGIHRATFYRSMHADATLRDAVEKAEADFVVSNLQGIDEAAQGGHWQARAWKLERRFPDEFGRRDRIHLTVEAKQEIERIASQEGIEPDAAIAEWERMLAESKR
jgi:transposase